ncbi:hypothetical protein LguiA_021697 [Lonicera macranthoides]
MARNKVILARIANDSKRKSTLKKRRDSLFKKIEELSTLCEVEPAVVVYARGEEEEELGVWPSKEVTEERFRRYEFIPDVEKTLKMTTQETYLHERVAKETEKIEREEKKNNENEISLIMNQLADGMMLTMLDTRQLNAMYAFAEESLKKLKNRSKKLKEEI